MRNDECMTRKWKEKNKESHIEICSFKCREKGFYLIFIYYISYFHRKERFKWGFYLIKREQVLLIK